MPRALVKEAGDRLSSRKEAGYSSCQNRSEEIIAPGDGSRMIRGANEAPD